MTTAYGSYLRSAREGDGKSLRQVAQALGISHVYLSEVELGKRGPLHARYEAPLVRALPRLSFDTVHRLALVHRFRQALARYRPDLPEALVERLFALIEEAEETGR